MAERPVGFGKPSSSVVESGAAMATGERYEQLRAQRERLHERRVRREIELANAEREERQCAEEAGRFGASSLEDLQRLIEERRRQDIEALDRFQAALAEEEALLDEIDRKIGQI